MHAWDLMEPQTKQLPFDQGVIRLTLSFVETPAGPSVRIAARHSKGGDGTGINLGGAFISLHGPLLVDCPPSEGVPRGLSLSVRSAIFGAVGSVLSQCISADSWDDTRKIQDSVRRSSELMLDEALFAVSRCL
jgi:hypothetical protein